MENQKGIDFIIHTFLEYCDEEKLKVSGYEKLYKEENIFEFENKIIARFAMLTKIPLMIEMYLDGSITLFFNMFECDPLTAAVLTKKFCEEQNVDQISSFVEMKIQMEKYKNFYLVKKLLSNILKKNLLTPRLTYI